VVRRQEGQLDTPAIEKWIVADEKSVGSVAHKRCKCRI
jgi:hypothetical protein